MKTNKKNATSKEIQSLPNIQGKTESSEDLNLHSFFSKSKSRHIDMSALLISVYGQQQKTRDKK
jgi:hypothetical protein